MEATPMRIRTEIFQSIFIITCEGSSLDVSLAQKFLTAMNDFIIKSQLDIILDLSAVRFVDNNGLGSIVRCLNQKDDAGTLLLCGIDERVLNLLKMTRLDNIFIPKANRKAALSHFFWERKKTNTIRISADPKSHFVQDKNSKKKVTEVHTPEEDQAILWEVDEEDFEEIVSDEDIEDIEDIEEKNVPIPSEAKDTNSEKAPEERRRYRRIEHKQIMNDDFVIYCKNTATGRHHPAVVLNISPGGLLMTSRSQLSIGDELLLEGRIGRYFKFKERAVSRSCRQQKYGLEFINLSADTTHFLDQLTGSVDMIQSNRFHHDQPN
jgi:anti-sigma B factor antagonist